MARLKNIIVSLLIGIIRVIMLLIGMVLLPLILLILIGGGIEYLREIDRDIDKIFQRKL